MPQATDEPRSSSSPSSAARPRCSPTRGRRRCARASGRTRAPAWRRRTPYTYNSANWDAFDRWSESSGGTVRLGVSSQYLPADMQAYAPLLDESGDWRYTAVVRLRRGIRASRPTGVLITTAAGRRIRATAGRGSARIRFALADASLRPLGILRGRRGSGFLRRTWAPGVRVVGVRARLRELVPARLRQPPIFAIDLYRVGPGYYSPWRGVDGGVVTRTSAARDHWVNQRAVNWDHVNGQRPTSRRARRAPASRATWPSPRNSTPIRWAGSRSVVPDGRRPRQSRATSRPATDSAAGSTGRSRARSRRQRSGVTPRYINRGDEIVRSQTERPSPPPRASHAHERRSVAVPRADDPRMVRRSGCAPRPRPDVRGAARTTARRAAPFGRRSEPGSRGPAPEPRQPYQGPRSPEPDREPYDRPAIPGATPAPHRQPERAAAPERAPGRADSARARASAAPTRQRPHGTADAAIATCRRPPPSRAAGQPSERTRGRARERRSAPASGGERRAAAAPLRGAGACETASPAPAAAVQRRETATADAASEWLDTSFGSRKTRASSSCSCSRRSSARSAASSSPSPATCRRFPRSTTTRRARSRASTDRTARWSASSRRSAAWSSPTKRSRRSSGRRSSRPKTPTSSSTSGSASRTSPWRRRATCSAGCAARSPGATRGPRGRARSRSSSRAGCFRRRSASRVGDTSLERKIKEGSSRSRSRSATPRTRSSPSTPTRCTSAKGPTASRPPRAPTSASRRRT